jgi:hypothetical protein
VRRDDFSSEARLRGIQRYEDPSHGDSACEGGINPESVSIRAAAGLSFVAHRGLSYLGGRDDEVRYLLRIKVAGRNELARIHPDR